jgi:hypothetical protein
LKLVAALKHDIRMDLNQDERPLIGPTLGDFFIPMTMYAVVLRHEYWAFQMRFIYRILHFFHLSFCKQMPVSQGFTEADYIN